MNSQKFNLCLEKIRKKDLQGIEEIYNEYYQIMITTALYKVKVFSAAEDIASEFIKYLIVDAVNIEYVENPGAWINRIIKCRAIDYIRKEARKVNPDNCDEYFAIQDNNIIRQTLIEISKQLSEYQKYLLTLHFFDGYKYKEISKLTARPIGTIKSDMSIIKDKLRCIKKL